METSAQLFVRCLENEGVAYIFGIPGEENLFMIDALQGSTIRFITTRHEQGAAFMADVYGRLTHRAGVCLSTLGPGATNLMTGFADANMDHAPVVAIAGQGATTRMHKESHQIVDLQHLFAPVAKYAVAVLEPENVPEIVRKAFKVAQAEKPGGAFISFPENIAGHELAEPMPVLKVQGPLPPAPHKQKILQAVATIDQARFPIILAGNGVVRGQASQALVHFAEQANIPVATTFMAKGVIPFAHPLSLGTIGLQARDYVACGFDRADVIIAVGFDMVEYPPALWHPAADKKIVHIDQQYAEVDSHYILEVGVIGDIALALEQLASRVRRHRDVDSSGLHRVIADELGRYAQDDSWPPKPQRIVGAMRQALAPDDILVCDVGAHKMWVARLYPCHRPNTCIISNGFAAMGIAVPGGVAARLACPERRVLAVTGDGGFMMNSQEIATAMRYQLPFVILIWNDGEYGLIRWHQERRFGRVSHIAFDNPDFVRYAESFGAKGYRLQPGDDLAAIIGEALAADTVVVLDVPVDYSENMKLTEKLGRLVCPL